MRVDDVVGECPRVPRGVVGKPGGRDRDDGVEVAQQRGGIRARLAAALFDGAAAVAAEIKAVALEHRGGPEVSRDDLADRLIERGSHGSSLHDHRSRPVRDVL